MVVCSNGRQSWTKWRIAECRLRMPIEKPVHQEIRNPQSNGGVHPSRGYGIKTALDPDLEASRRKKLYEMSVV